MTDLQIWTMIGVFVAVVGAMTALLSSNMKTGFAAVNQRIDGVDQRLNRVDQRLDKVETRLSGVEQNVTALTINVAVLNDRVGVRTHLLLGEDDKGSEPSRAIATDEE